MIDSKIPLKPRKMVDFLLEQIHSGNLAAGSKLPPLRVLMAQFELSYGSAKRGIDYLDERGIVEKRAKSGVFVSSKALHKSSKDGLRLSLFFRGSVPEDRPGIYPTVFLGIQKAAARAGVSLTANYVDSDRQASKHIRNLSQGADGIILLSEYDRVLTQLPVPLPTVGVCMCNSLGGAVSLVDIDPFDCAEQAVAYFRRKQLNRVYVVSDNVEYKAYRSRGELFALRWTRQGGETVCVMMDNTPFPDAGAGYLYETTSILQHHSQQVLEQTGKTLAEQASVLGIDGKNLLDPTFHRAPVIALDWQTAGQQAFDECIFRINNPGAIPRRIYLPGKIVEK